MKLTYRFLEQDDIPQAVALYDSYGFGLPSPLHTQYLGMFDEEHLVGVVPLQLVLHAEPVVVDEAARSAVDWTLIRDACDQATEALGFPGYCILASRREVGFLASRLGMDKKEGELWLRDLT